MQPDDGPIGEFLRALGRHPHRSSHIHFMLKAPGYDECVLFSSFLFLFQVPSHLLLVSISSLTTALYPAHSPFLGTDPVFATKKSLVRDLVVEKDPKKWAEMGFDPEEVQKNAGRVWIWKFDFVLPTVQEVAELKKSLPSVRS